MTHELDALAEKAGVPVEQFVLLGRIRVLTTLIEMMEKQLKEAIDASAMSPIDVRLHGKTAAVGGGSKAQKQSGAKRPAKQET
jgi:hypothetical protein